MEHPQMMSAVREEVNQILVKGVNLVLTLGGMHI